MQIERAHEDGRISFQDGSVVHADVILHCTGYIAKFLHYFFFQLSFRAESTLDNYRCERNHVPLECVLAFLADICVTTYLLIWWTDMLCIRYKYHYPFLPTSGVVNVDDNRVGPLYKHVFPPALAPGISFVGVPAFVRFPLVLCFLPSWGHLMFVSN